MTNEPSLERRGVLSEIVFEVDEKNDQIAHHRIVAGRGILRNLGRNNNSPATGTTHPLSDVLTTSAERPRGFQPVKQGARESLDGVEPELIRP
jgi:hypothetical protein